MKYLLLSISLFVASSCAHAKETLMSLDSAEQIANPSLVNSFSGWKSEKRMNLALPYSGSSGGSRVHFLYGLDLGYFAPKITSSDNISGSGGFMLKVDMGLGIELSESRRGGGTNFLSLTAFYSFFDTKIKSKDPLGNSQTDDITLTTIGVPISYTHLSSREGGGVYWQLGVNLVDVNDASDGNNTLTSHYNSFYVDPFLSLGLSIPFELRRSRRTIGTGLVLFGPFISYAATNMSADKGETMHGYTFGISYRYMFM